MNEQDRNTFERHPAYDTGDTGVPGAEGAEATPAAPRLPRTSATGGSPRSRAAALVSVLGAVIALVTLAVGYAVVRWSDEPAAGFVVAVAVGLLVLAALAVVAGRVGGLATFVVIALLLPFATALSALAAAGQRIDDGLEDLFGSSDDSSLTWDENTQEAEQDEPSPAEKAIALGESGVANEFTVTVAGIECTQKLAEATENPDHFGEEDVPEFLDTEAPAGKQFCVVTSSWSNTSKEPGSVDGWSSFGALVSSDGTKFSALTDDSELSSTLTEQAGYDGGVLNPGDEAEVRTVFTVADDQEFDHAVVEQFDLENPEVWFALT